MRARAYSFCQCYRISPHTFIHMAFLVLFYVTACKCCLLVHCFNDCRNLTCVITSPSLCRRVCIWRNTLLNQLTLPRTKLTLLEKMQSSLLPSSLWTVPFNLVSWLSKERSMVANCAQNDQTPNYSVFLCSFIISLLNWISACTTWLSPSRSLVCNQGVSQESFTTC